MAAGLDLWRWEEPGGYPTRFKAKTIAWYRLHGLVQAHSHEAALGKPKK